MGQLTVTFKGICTHFLSLPEITLPGPVHRAVLINASGENVINGIRIPAHIARITLSATTTTPEPQTFALQGVNLSLAGSTSPPLNYEPSYQAIPTLEEQMSEIEPLSMPATSLLIGEQWPAVAAYFTVEAGTFSGCVSAGAAEVILTLETDVPEVVTLNATPFPGAPPLPFASVPIQLVSPATITISNLAANPMDELLNPRSHFFLHYLLAETYPSVPQAPFVILGEPCGENLPTIDAGCSDSNYP